MKQSSERLTVVLALVLASGAAFARNVIPNPSFEEDTEIPNGDFVTNVDPGFHTSGWKGGILTAGRNKTFCTLTMADGQYGMALHWQYPSTSTEFVLDEGGPFLLKFRYAPREFATTEQTYGMYVKVRFDDSTEDVVKVAPTDYQKWGECSCMVNLSAGTHTITFLGELKPGVADASTVVDGISLESYYDINLIPNASFEDETDIPAGNFVTNVDPDYHTSFWRGGILTIGGNMVTFCDAPMYDGRYGMALHREYPSTELDFTVPIGGKFLFSFAGVSRKQEAQLSCKNTVTAYIDDEPVASLLPESYSSWTTTSGKIRLQAGTHHLRLTGVTPGGIDSSTVIDGIMLKALPTKGLTLIVR